MSSFAIESLSMEVRGRLEKFSLLGGPLHRLGRRLGLVRGETNTVALGLALGMLSWSILLALASIGGVSDKLFSLSAIAADVRLLVVIPLFFLCESSLDPQLRDFVSTIVRSGVVPSNALPTLESEIARIVRWKDAWLPEAMCLLAAIILSLFAAQLHLSGKTAALDSTRSLSDVPFAGLWYWIVCLPLFRFLMFRWIWRIALWCRLLWRLAKLDLHLVPIHPDGAAGLGYLEIVQTHFTALVLAISIVVSASFAEEISSGKTVFEVIYPAFALTLIVELALIFLPPCVFAFRLRACQEKGLCDYMVFAARYVNDFEKKWLNASAIPADPLLGTADLQSLADLSNSVGIVRNMRWVPVSTRLLVTVVIAALLPMLPLLLFKYPIAELVQRVLSKLAGL
ncbi:MAG: hypothetical protein WCC90_17670 [Methylocella sp.]